MSKLFSKESKMFLFLFFSFLIMLHGHIFFLSSFPPLCGLWLSPNHIWNKSIISNDLFLWGFLVRGFGGSQECRAVIYHHSALSDSMYSHVSKSQAIGWMEKCQGMSMMSPLTDHWWCEKLVVEVNEWSLLSQMNSFGNSGRISLYLLLCESIV